MTAFLIIGLAGVVLLGISLVVGDLFDGALDVLGGEAFSSAVLGGFVSAFGFATALVQGFAPTAVAVPVGLVTGGLFGWLAWWLVRTLREGGSDATIQVGDSVGHTGTVLSAIPAAGYGTVRVRVGGHTLQLNARAELELDAGTEVHVVEALSPTAVAVAPTWSGLPPAP